MADYLRATSTEQAGQLVAADADARFLAGGQSLLPSMRLGLSAPTQLVDLQDLRLDRIWVENEATVHIGAMCRHEQVAASRDVQGLLPGLAMLAAQIGDRQVRRMGTIGGSIANADPAACYPAGLLGLGATVHTKRRAIAADDFFVGIYTTALDPGELIERVSFPIARLSSWQKFKQPASRFSLVGVFVNRDSQGVRVGVTGAAPCAFRAHALEAALAADWSPAAARAVKIDASMLMSDLHGSAEYRAALIPELCARAVAAIQ
ncbi:FAD binding domain-containing protein [Pseudorhodoferax sp.]|uniref:FAD binding domain-containing protein n=1 Tax=Pseudorhodoferax sp. TaxID=1993553 RepID=UPI001B78B6DF|nr:xanthine dehydrogenase family protein subunit M [Pseudorhodoferax sp.]MBP8143993.1 xanthine dehydrogenase family protein subunit M [Inhella sp.]